MANITVKEVQTGSETTCEVVVSEGASKTVHQVQMPEKLYKELTGGKISKADCVATAFRFLLDREPKESILRKFDLALISQYFPEFEREFSSYL